MLGEHAQAEIRREDVETGRPTITIGDDIVIDLTVDPPALILRDKYVSLDPSPQPVRARLATRIVDVVGAAAALLVLCPLMLTIAAAVRATSAGPVIFRSKRMAPDGTVFHAFKFRTMHPDAETMLVDLLDRDPLARAEYHRTAKLVHDPRVTALGRLLRRTSLDELPQFLNVLRGEMSLVGPRPNLLDEPDRYGVAWSTVTRVKPGLTGLWQVSGRNTLDFDDRIMLDVEYATTRTLRGDVKILARTISHLSNPDGAY